MLPNQSHITDLQNKLTLDAKTEKEAGHCVLFVVETKYEYYILDFSTIIGAVKIDSRELHVHLCVINHEIIVLGYKISLPKDISDFSWELSIMTNSQRTHSINT